ncbi:Tubulin_tyrosine ligase [Hexamita inflata]|uniref:Tubulin--tyrosine ligase-like protein 5 n=1 Tax=Hexamita inflata TaxID=28002 RepID=A0AA86U542_9EUKA|nr:Tubulin tyrosine ligase [Hexamita inflata]
MTVVTKISSRMQHIEDTKKMEIYDPVITQSPGNNIYRFGQLNPTNPNIKVYPRILYRGPTSRIIRETFAKAGFKVTTNLDSGKFNVCWGTPKSKDFIRNMAPGQLLNHLPGQESLTRKDNLASTLQEFAKKYPEQYNFIPLSFVMPEDSEILKRHMQNNNQYYIHKHACAARGEGISLINSLSKFNSKKAAVVQEYINNPLLINGYKFDLRIYVVVTSVDPLVAYVFDEGLARFATEPWTKPTKLNSQKKQMHLTNYSVNKSSKNFKSNSSSVVQEVDSQDSVEFDEDFQDIDPTQNDTSTEQLSSKMKFSDILQYLENNRQLFENSYNPESVSESITQELHRIIKLTLIAANTQFVTQGTSAAAHCFPRKCFGFYGFDVMILNDGTLRLIEVNLCPATGTSTTLDYEVKSKLLNNMFDLLGINAQFKNGKYHVPKTGTGEYMKSKYSKDGNLTDYEKCCMTQIADENSRKDHFIRLLPDKQYTNLIEAHKTLYSYVFEK